VCEYYGLEHFDIRKAIERDGTLNFDQVADNSIDYLLYPEEEKPRVCVLEDIDKFAAFQGGDVEKDYSTISLHSLLKGLDGVDQTDGIILFATTNFPDVLHEALVGRPGRFDKIYHIDKPNQENICNLIKYYKISVKDGSIEDIAKELVGSSMAFVAEFVKLTKMKYKRNDILLEEARTILKAIHEHQELCENHFKEPKNIGFKK
jgi:ATP-dependent Zn protease